MVEKDEAMKQIREELKKRLQASIIAYGDAGVMLHKFIKDFKEDHSKDLEVAAKRLGQDGVVQLLKMFPEYIRVIEQEDGNVKLQGIPTEDTEYNMRIISESNKAMERERQARARSIQTGIVIPRGASFGQTSAETRHPPTVDEVKNTDQILLGIRRPFSQQNKQQPPPPAHRDENGRASNVAKQTPAIFHPAFVAISHLLEATMNSKGKKWMVFIVDGAVTSDEASAFVTKLAGRNIQVPVNEPVDINTAVLNEPRIDLFFERFASCGVTLAVFFVPDGKNKQMYDLIRDQEDFGIMTQMITKKRILGSENRSAILDSIGEQINRKLHHAMNAA